MVITEFQEMQQLLHHNINKNNNNCMTGVDSGSWWTSSWGEWNMHDHGLQILL